MMDGWMDGWMGDGSVSTNEIHSRILFTTLMG